VPQRLAVQRRRELLELARRAVQAAVAAGTRPPWPRGEPELAAPGAAFVTLRERDTGDLRGCRGEIVAVRPLAESVIEGAIAAAIDDPRFPPVRDSEVDGLSIEISVLTPMTVAAPDQVDVDRHGVMITCRGRRGLLLPQVAGELGWNREQLLEGVCRKAGLPAEAWRRQDARLEVFEADVWDEEEDETAG
jgi:AmmeMemoRadiSam system protein A